MKKRKKKCSKKLQQSSNDILFDADDFSRSCSSKKAYETDWQAKFAADECKSRDPTLMLSWYKCRYCGKWHLTEV